MLRYGADLNSSTAEGKSLVHLSAEKDFAYIIAYLERLGVPLSKKNIYGQTPLHLAVDMNAHKAVSLLLALQVKRSLKDTKGQTPLHIAAKNNNGRMVRLLLLKGSNKDLKDTNNFTPIELATDKEIQNLFKKPGFLEIFGYKPMLADGLKTNYIPFLTLCLLLLGIFILNSVFLENCKRYFS